MTWAISWAITAASSLSDSVITMSPAFTAMIPPGPANALTLDASTTRNRYRRSGVRARDALSQGVDVVDHLGVVDQSNALADLAEKRIPETFFLGARERLARRIAEVGQRGVGGGRGQNGEQPQDDQDRSSAPPPRIRPGVGEDAPCAGRRGRGHVPQSSPEIHRIQDSSSDAVAGSAK